MAETKLKQTRTFEGEVVSNKMQKTIVVRVDYKKLNKKYQKSVGISTKYHVHDENQIAKIGDIVKFVECRPYSKTKRWYLKEVVK